MVVLMDAQWAVVEPLVEACRPHAKVPPSDLRALRGQPWRRGDPPRAHPTGARLHRGARSKGPLAARRRRMLNRRRRSDSPWRPALTCCTFAGGATHRALALKQSVRRLALVAPARRDRENIGLTPVRPPRSRHVFRHGAGPRRARQRVARGGADLGRARRHRRDPGPNRRRRLVPLVRALRP